MTDLSMYWSKLAEKATWDELSPQELALVINNIKTSKPGSSILLSIWIYTLGRTASYDQRKLLEKFLYYPSDPVATKEALRVLCNYWCFTSDYLDQVKSFIKGVDWDVDDDVRMQALSIAGRYLRDQFDIELLRMLLDFFDNLGVSKHFYISSYCPIIFLKCCAYEALARAMGKNWDEVPDNDDIEYDLENNQTNFIDFEMLDRARQLAKI